MLGKAVLQVNFAHLLLQNNGHVASMKKKCFEAIYPTYLQKNKHQENLQW